VGTYYYIERDNERIEYVLERGPSYGDIYKLTSINGVSLTFAHYSSGEPPRKADGCYVFEVGVNAGQNSIVIGSGNYSNTDNQVILGSYANIKPDTSFAIGVGEEGNRKNLLEVNNRSIATIEGLEIRNTNNEASYTSQDCMVLRDIDTGWGYAYQMKSGALVTTLLPTHIKVTKLPDKVEYEQGTILDASGMEVTAFYPDGHS
jgi:hypothetical protein